MQIQVLLWGTFWNFWGGGFVPRLVESRMQNVYMTRTLPLASLESSELAATGLYWPASELQCPSLRYKS